MLYKKYHRNFVSQFKKGIEFRYRGTRDTDTVKEEPYALILTNFCRIRVESNKHAWILSLIFENGIINKYLHVIQEIS